MSRSLASLIVCVMCALMGCDDKVNYQNSAQAQADAQDDMATGNNSSPNVPDAGVRDVRETEPVNPDVREPEPVDIGRPEDVPPEPDLPPEPTCGLLESTWTVASSVDLGRTEFDQIFDIDILGNRAYVTHSVGVTVLDISDPASPDILGVFEAVQPGARALALLETREGLEGILAVLGDGVRKLDFPPNAAPVETGAYDLSGSAGAEYASDVEIVGNRSYVTSFSQGLWLFGADSLRPVVLGSCCQNREGNLLDGPAAVAVRDEHAYVVDNTSGLLVIDAVDPTSPTVIASLEVEGEFEAIALEGDRLVMGSQEGTLLYVDVSTPSDPTILWQVELRDVAGVSEPVLGVDFTDNVATIAAGQNNVFVVSFQQDPPRLINIPVSTTEAGITSVKVVEDTLYVADGDIFTIIKRECL